VTANPDRQFFETEVLRLTDRLYGKALRLTRNPADAEDLVADTVAKAWNKLEELRDPQCFETWIFRILTNAFLSQWRLRGAPQFEGREEPQPRGDGEEFSLFEQLHQPFLLWWSSPEQEFLNDLLREDLEEALDRLPNEFRIVVVLVMVQGHSYAEVAEMLCVPVGTVRSRLSRGRSLLQRALWEQAKEAGLRTEKEASRRLCQRNEP
jgi:RNA polymerase sigma factor (sigma-70 family)